MTNNANKREVKMPGGLRQKLTAAIAMLLVSAIMLVSATYAWFTLSTAPEVKGIQTSVGANGSLEMALLTTTVADIKSGVGDSSAVQEVTKANLTWGNLVDLSDASYGFNTLSLNPARLMFNDGGTALNDANMLLGTADYGADGRVSTISAARSMIAVAGTYAAAITATEDNPVNYGVRAIGDNSALSPEEVNLNNAKIVFAQAYEAAKNGAKSVLDTYGEKLAGIAVKHGTGAGSETYAKSDVEFISNVISALETEAAAIEAALKAEQIVTLTAANGADHTADEITVSNQDLTDLKNAIAAAKNAVPTAEKDSYTWTEIQPALSAVIDSNSVTVNGHKVSQLKDDLKNDTLDISSIISAPNVVTNSGILADIADFTGKYTSVGFSLAIEYNGAQVTLNNATLTADTTTPDTTPVLVTSAQTVAGAAVPDDKKTDTNAAISDNYGYAVDLAFRSNTNTNLQLQTEGVQRIYQDATVTNPDTQGGGSKMTFTSSVLTEAQMKALMGAIRVVFTVPGGTDVYGIATLDLTAPAEGTPTYSFTTTGNTVTGTANLVMSAYTVTDGKITVTGKAVSDTITALNQGEAKGVTAIVYLDGDIVDNSMVANASNSMTGSLNLQFSSSEDLTPMNYTPLKNN